MYALLDPTKRNDYKYDQFSFDHAPFYIGKGQGRRAWVHLDKAFSEHLKVDGHLNHKYNRIRKVYFETGMLPLVTICKENLVEADSLAFESYLIKLIGRRDFDKGPLLNRTDGGEGLSNVSPITREKFRKNCLGRKLSAETIKRISLSNFGKHSGPRSYSDESRKKLAVWRDKNLSDSHKANIKVGVQKVCHTPDFISKSIAPLFGRPVSLKTRSKISAANTGKIRSQEARKRISESLSGRGLSEDHRLKLSIATRAYWERCADKHLSQDHRVNLRKAAMLLHANKQLISSSQVSGGSNG